MTLASRPSLFGLQPFDLLTRAEAEVFDRHLIAGQLAKAETLTVQDALLILCSGQLEVRPMAGEERHGLTLAAGGLFGESELFDSQSVSQQLQAFSPADYLQIAFRDLKHCFRYSRTGAVKCLIPFARSLSSKLRAANELLGEAGSGGSGSGGSDSQISASLRPVPLSALDLGRLKVYTVRHKFETDTSIFAEGDASEELYVITEGTVDIRRDTADGEQLLARLGPGDFFGEMAFVDRRPRSAHAVATAPLTVQLVPAGTLEHLLEQSVGVGLYLADVVCKILARRLNVTLRRAIAG